MRFDGKVVLVTGGASGIGAATATRFAECGADVVIGDINVDAGEQVAEAIRAGGSRARFIRVDLTDRDSTKTWIEVARAHGGRIDALANVAGWTRVEPFVDNVDDFIDRIIGLNLRGAINLLKAIFPVMVEQAGGRIVLVASDAGRVGSPGESVYSATKGGVMGLTRALAREGARNGIAVNCVSPGAIDTPLLHTLTDKRREAFLKAIPQRRFGTAAEVADAILFLASARASYITGQVLSVNGGLSMFG